MKRILLISVLSILLLPATASAWKTSCGSIAELTGAKGIESPAHTEIAEYVIPHNEHIREAGQTISTVTEGNIESWNNDFVAIGPNLERLFWDTRIEAFGGPTVAAVEVGPETLVTVTFSNLWNAPGWFRVNFRAVAYDTRTGGECENSRSISKLWIP